MKLFLIILGLILILVPCIYLTIYRFHNIDMTNMRVFVNKWIWYIPVLIGLVLINSNKFLK